MVVSFCQHGNPPVGSPARPIEVGRRLTSVSDSGGQESERAADVGLDRLAEVDGHGQRQRADTETGDDARHVDHVDVLREGDQRVRQHERQAGAHDGDLAAELLDQCSAAQAAAESAQRHQAADPGGLREGREGGYRSVGTSPVDAAGFASKDHEAFPQEMARTFWVMFHQIEQRSRRFSLEKTLKVSTKETVSKVWILFHLTERRSFFVDPRTRAPKYAAIRLLTGSEVERLSRRHSPRDRSGRRVVSVTLVLEFDTSNRDNRKGRAALDMLLCPQ